MFEAVEVFEEEEPGGLLGVVELGGAAGLFAEDVVDVFEGLFEHDGDEMGESGAFFGAWCSRECSALHCARESFEARTRSVHT